MNIFWKQCNCTDTKFPHYLAFSDEPYEESWGDSPSEAFVSLCKYLANKYGIHEVPMAIELI